MASAPKFNFEDSNQDGPDLLTIEFNFTEIAALSHPFPHRLILVGAHTVEQYVHLRRINAQTPVLFL